MVLGRTERDRRVDDGDVLLVVTASLSVDLLLSGEFLLTRAARWKRRAAPVLCVRRGIFLRVDALRKDDLETARTTPGEEKLRQALELMALGIELQRRKLRAADPSASEAVIEGRMLAWLTAPR
jgi:Rv0078B-related antitoxin